MVIMENYIPPQDRLDELWLELERCHLSYLELEESPEKIEQRNKLEEIIYEFLCIAPHRHKFCYAETEEVLQMSASRKKDFSAYKASTGFAAIQLYAGNLLSQPWRKEYRTIKRYLSRGFGRGSRCIHRYLSNAKNHGTSSSKLR
ncbi:unnamed protein product [Acanthoscelides obtectus]|uniref:Uncharacterized protein n=1 Tax=Acanthoscelides obtectus TaxID=200917 RepID=A0A9P0JL94_ACAOB|nr:unnamed protein product [Acanthoscelides obtectus]CAK1672868.1 Protein tamozhennic [Acanthoscelides obtectus]